MDKGSYILFLQVNSEVEFKTKAKSWKLKPGIYVYIGSGMGGLTSRVKRHLKVDKKRHWHIDFLLPHVKVLGALLLPSNKREEDFWSMFIGEYSIEAVEGFGSSDRNTVANLYRLKDEDMGELLANILRKRREINDSFHE